MLSPLQVKKQTHFFNILDFDNNGFIQQDDFEAIADNLCIIRDFDLDTPEYDTVKEMTDAIWNTLIPFVNGTEGNLQHWLQFMNALMDPKHEEQYKKYIQNFVSSIYRLFDLNDDGFISQTEYIDLFIGMRIEVRFAPKAFRKLDENNDGRLSKEEVFHAVDEFMRSTDPDATGNWLFGSWE